MHMNVFISWSGERSKRVGELLDEWIQCVLQAINPWMSSKDIDRGSLWFSEINDQLQDTSVGIVCLTTTNLENPWILFEAGALAKGLSHNRVCTFLVDVKPTDINPPLSQFNHTFPTKDGLWKLVKTLNKSLDDSKLAEKILSKVFETYWPQFNARFGEILEETKNDKKLIVKDDKDMLQELLYMSRSLDNRLRRIEREGIDNRELGDWRYNYVISDKSDFESRANIVKQRVDKSESTSIDFWMRYFDGIMPKNILYDVILSALK